MSEWSCAALGMVVFWGMVGDGEREKHTSVVKSRAGRIWDGQELPVL